MNWNIHVLTLAILLFYHWIADFRYQTLWMAENKSTSNRALGAHVLVYTLIMSIIGVILLGFWFGLAWAILNGVIHFGVDYVTSRMTRIRWKEQRVHDFFEVVGVDQWIHTVTLVATFVIFQS